MRLQSGNASIQCLEIYVWRRFMKDEDVGDKYKEQMQAAIAKIVQRENPGMWNVHLTTCLVPPPPRMFKIHLAYLFDCQPLLVVNRKKCCQKINVNRPWLKAPLKHGLPKPLRYFRIQAVSRIGNPGDDGYTTATAVFLPLSLLWLMCTWWWRDKYAK